MLACYDLNVDAGYILLCHEGCGMYSILIVNTEDQETYGTVWYYVFFNSEEIIKQSKGEVGGKS